MKPIIPTIPLNVWADLYTAAAAFQAKRPWELLDDMDIVGVRDPLTSEPGYGVVMGSGGTIFGLCMYRGAEGFAIYRNLMSGESDPESDDAFAGQNCLKVEFGPRSDLLSEDLAVIRNLELKFKGKHAWPEFRSLKPGFLPWFLTEPEARFLTVVIKALCYHHDKVDDGIADESFRDGEVLFYSPVAGSDSEFVWRWERPPSPVPPPLHMLQIDEARIASVLAQNPKPDSPWESDVFYIPSSIYEGKCPYFVRMAVVCHQDSGFCFAQDVLTPEMTPTHAVADAIISSIEKLNVLPRIVFVRRHEDAASLTPLGKALGIAIRQRKKLDTIQALKNEIIAWMMKEGGKGSVKR